MRSFALLPLLAQLCRAFVSPDIYTVVQPDTPSPDPGQSSRPPTVPSQSRHAAGPASGLNLFLPNYQVDPNWLPLTLSLKTVGLQVKVIESLDISSQCRNLLIYTSPSVTYNPSPSDVATLTSFVNGGGNLIFMNQVPTALQALAGVSASTIDNTGSRSVLQLIKDAETSEQVLKGFEFGDFYDISMPFYDNYTESGFVNVGYTPVQESQVLGQYLVRNNGVDSADTSDTRASIVKHQPSGATGHVYSFGLDLGYLYNLAQSENYGLSPWYDGHYYPGYDIGNRVIKNIVTSSAHFASLWTVPYNKGLAFTTTWDIDTYISYPHGQGIAAAAMERGAYGNLNLHTKYITDAYETAYFQYGVPYIYQITGFRTAADGYPYIDFGSHTVSHSPNAVQFPYGTLNERFIQGSYDGYAPTIYQCDPSAPHGTPDDGQSCTRGGTSGLSFWTAGGTASGEVRVSAFLIRHILNTEFKTDYNMTTYRPGNLAFNKYQANHCVANGIIGGSSCSGNAHLTHLPFQVTHNREPFEELPYYEFPLQWSDGDGNMSSADFPGSDFANQIIGIEKMARYGGQYNILIHPSDAVLDKIQIQRALHDRVRPYAVFFNQTGFANWWTLRDRAQVDITSASDTAVEMTVRLDGPVEGLTVQVPGNYVLQSSQSPLNACQQPSFDGLTNAVVLTSTAKGLYTLKFSVGASDASASTCPDFTPQPIAECVAWDVAVDDFLELYFYNNGVNLLLLQTSTVGLSSNNVDGTLQLTANNNTANGVNSYYTEISRFCFDATLYTHLFFDMVASVGTRFYVQLVSFDEGCNKEQPSQTYLDITDYAAVDGTNHTVSIPLADFAGQDMTRVRGIRIGNISPVQTPLYIDNIKIQKRCSQAPGDDNTRGLSIDSFQNVDRWITGINNINGQTDYDNSMTFAKLSELGKMQLLPSDSGSYFYTSTVVKGKNLDATSYESLSLNVQGPSGGSFDIVVTSGAGANSTVNTASYASLSQNDFANITVPLSAFSGLDAAAINRITLQNFTPNGGSRADVFTVRWISLLGGKEPTPRGTKCTRATGYVVLDFCDTDEFRKQTNALDAPFSDDNTMQTYTQTAPGNIDLVPRDTSSYFYTLFSQPGGCATVNSSYNAFTLSIAGPVGSTVSVGFRHGAASCNTNVVTSLVPITLNGPRMDVTIPFSRFPASFNPNNIQSFVMTNFGDAGQTYRLYSLALVGPSDSPGCSRCSGTLLNTCAFVSTPPTTNQLQGVVSDESTLSSYSVNTDGSLELGTTPTAYWYSQFGRDSCYNANRNNATGLQISVAAPSGTTLDVTLRWMTDANCTTQSSPVSLPITSYVTFSGNASYQVAQIPLSDFAGLNASRLSTVSLSGFAPSNMVRLGCVSLISIPDEIVPLTCTCPASAWLNYCAGGRPDRNAIGGIQSDDGTMKATPAIENNALQLQPASASSYWYSLLNCMDVSSESTLYVNVTANAGATFNIQLQSSGSDCADSSSLQRASVASASYGAMTGRPVLLSIPLSAFAGQNAEFLLKAINAVVLDGFSDQTATYTLNCAYFANSANASSIAVA
ncbi:unnamed protein product [Periconia digitata]|uniref:Uncharacterized protein n=1 Tax=Periconia digitata TaxID=1303443 RepID=A0A9W4XP91_9PLEO|nr:unnamed protein product [Periconia digitata]